MVKNTLAIQAVNTLVETNDSDYISKKNIKPYQQLKSIDALLNNMDLLVLELYGSQIAGLDNAPDWAQDPYIDKEILSQLFKNAKSAKNQTVNKRGDLSTRVENMLGELTGWSGDELFRQILHSCRHHNLNSITNIDLFLIDYK